MKRQIRQNVFETNSSSMHSLVVKKNSEYFTEQEVKDDLWVSENGLIDLPYNDMYYGRSPFQVLSSFREKMFYVIASMCNFKGDLVYNEVKELVRSYIPHFTDFDTELETHSCSTRYWTQDEMKKCYGEGNYIRKDDYFVYWNYALGGVDEDILTGFLEKENITITEFITNKRYVVIVDGDEYCIYKDMKRNGLINMDNIEKEYPPSDWMDCDEEKDCD